MSESRRSPKRSDSGGTLGASAAVVESTGYQVGPETWVEVVAQVFDADGERVQGTDEPVGFVFGMGQLLPALEAALEGCTAGQLRSVELDAPDAYGERDEARVVAVDRPELPLDVRPGDRIELEDEHGAVLVVRVLAVGDDEVLLDFNHPLAGQKVRFELQTRQVRPASSAEISAAERALEPSCAQASSLVAPQSLLRGTGQRYEIAPTAGHAKHQPAHDAATEEKKA